jgi:predicted NACHT family NTPase
LDEELRALADECADGAELAERLAALGYAVPGFERGVLGEGDSLDIAGLLELEQAVVLGDPGSGKSTLLRYVAYAAATQNAERVGEAALGRLPVRRPGALRPV